MKNKIIVSVGVLIIGANIIYLFIHMHNNYTELLKVNQDLQKQLEESRETFCGGESLMTKEYDKLYGKYCKVLVENEELKDTIQKQKNKAKIPTYKYSYGDVMLLAKCVQAEAGAYEGHEESQRIVTKVLLNRVESEDFPNTLPEVIYEKHEGIPQFSVTCNGAIEKQKVSKDTLLNVLSVLIYGDDTPKNVLYFYASSVEENWVNTLRVYKTVQGTTFAYGCK